MRTNRCNFLTDAMRGGGRWLVVAMVLGAFVATGHAQVIFTDTFEEGTGDWYKAFESGDTTLTNEAGRLSFTSTAAGGYEVIGRGFSSQTIEVGDTITLSFDFRQKAATGILRFGLHNLVEVAVSADHWARTSSGSYAGYTTFIRDNESNVARSETADFDTRDDNNFPTHGASGTTRTITEDGGSTNFTLQNDTDYQFTFSVTRVSETQTDTVLLVMEGDTERYNVVGSHTSSPHFDTFNAATLRVGGSGTALFNNIELLGPEPIVRGTVLIIK